MEAALTRIINKIKDQALRDMVINLFQEPIVRLGDKTYEGPALDISPASKRRHHSYVGGLLHHLASSSRIALTLCDVAERIYGANVDRDIVLAAILVHDVMKPLTYRIGERGTYDTSELGERLDHLSLIVSELLHRGFPLDVIHAVAAHHGRNSPISPRTLEALICFLADFSDAALIGETLKAAKSLVERCVGEQITRLRAEDAFAIVQAKKSRGCDGVKNAVKEIQLRRTELQSN